MFWRFGVWPFFRAPFSFSTKATEVGPLGLVAKPLFLFHLFQRLTFGVGGETPSVLLDCC